MGGDGLTDENTHTGQNWYKFPQPIPTAEPLIVESDDIGDWLKPVAGKPLTFRTVGQSKPITLVPYHELFDQRYVVYWRVLKKGGEAHKKYLAEQRRREQWLARIVDSVNIGRGESEKGHNLQGERTQAGSHAGRNWRDARDGGWFGYDLKVFPDEAMTLLCTFWGSDVGRTFDVVVDGRKMATVTLNNNKPG